MKKVVVNPGCIACQSCTSALTPEELEISKNYINMSEDGTMKSTDKSIENPEHIAIIEKMKNSCPMQVIDIVDA